MKNILIFAFMTAGLIGTVSAQWQPDGMAICIQTGVQSSPKVVSDNAHGAIIVWEDYRQPSNPWVYVQLVDSAGFAKIGSTGRYLFFSVDPIHQNDPDLVADGAGGAIITCRIGNNVSDPEDDIYVQRVGASGFPQWGPSGIPVCDTTGFQGSPVIASDRARGAIIAWVDYRKGDTSDVYAQRVDSNGSIQWDRQGEAICTKAGRQYEPEIVADGVGGAIVAWLDDRSDTSDIYAQRISGAAVRRWTKDGVVICSAPGTQYGMKIVSDGARGALVTWTDMRNGNADIYAQRVDSAGVVRWHSGGVAIATATGQQSFPEIVPDGTGGAIITWRDMRNGNADIYAQRVDGTGRMRWTTNGVPICIASRNQSNPAIASDARGTAIITWQDDRASVDTTDIYTQRVDSNGVAQWTADGVLVCTATRIQSNPAIVSNGIDSAIVVWEDMRNGGVDYDLYAQQVNSDGTTGVVSGYAGNGPMTFMVSEASPNPSHGIAAIRYQLPKPAPVTLQVYTIAGTLVGIYNAGMKPAGRHEIRWDAGSMQNSVYFYRLQAGEFSATRKLFHIR